MNQRLGICEWSVPLKDEALFSWMKEMEIGNVSIESDYGRDTGRRNWEEIFEEDKNFLMELI